jgi:peptidoglycan/xylan/chitin deacetylase (PgdA/CDA1 family)
MQVQPEHAVSWREMAPRGPRATARRATLSALGWSMKASGVLQGLLARPRVQVLILHHIFADEEAEFRELLRTLSRDHSFISYSEAIERAQTGGKPIDRPYIALSFDDGLRNCLRAAAIAQEFGAKACFFVCPGIVGETRETVIRSFCERLQIPPVEFMNWDHLESLRNSGHEIGGHTMTHVNLARISASEAHDEIAGSFEALKRRLGEPKHFAWTYGSFADFTAEAARSVYRGGYSSCASGVRGCHGPAGRPSANGETSPICIRRDHVVAGWPISHVLYFLARSSRRMSSASGDWPSGWAKVIGDRSPTERR